MQGLAWVGSTVLLKFVLSTILGASDDVSQIDVFDDGSSRIHTVSVFYVAAFSRLTSAD